MVNLKKRIKCIVFRADGQLLEWLLNQLSSNAKNLKAVRLVRKQIGLRLQYGSARVPATGNYKLNWLFTAKEEKIRIDRAALSGLRARIKRIEFFKLIG